MSTPTQIKPGVYRLYEPVSPRCYKIVRIYHPSTGRKTRVVRHNVTLTEAQAHCSRPDTRKEGVWFDGYDWEKGCKP